MRARFARNGRGPWMIILEPDDDTERGLLNELVLEQPRWAGWGSVNGVFDHGRH